MIDSTKKLVILDNNNEVPRITQRTKGHTTENNRSRDRLFLALWQDY